MNIKELVEDYILHSVIYYRFGDSVIPDSMYDDICKNLLDNIEEAKKYSPFIEEELLRAGSGYAFVYKVDDQVVQEALETIS